MPNLRNSLALWVSDTSTAIGNLHHLVDLGFTRLIVCLVKHDHVPHTYPYQPDNLKRLLDDAASIGLPVDGWIYGYPTGIEQQVSTIAAVVNAHHQIQNLILDMEVEWERADPALAEQFCHSLAVATAHRVPLYLSSFDNPSSHPLPYEAFLKHCAGFMPQSYQVDGTPVRTVMSRTMKQSAPLAAGSLGKEFVPTVNSPAILAALAATPGPAIAVNVWCYDGGGVDRGVRGHESEWGAAIAAYRAKFK